LERLCKNLAEWKKFLEGL
jgi:hypothetical protein